LAIADRVVVMNAGRLEQVGTPWELYDRPQTRFVASFIGRGNFLSGQVQGNAIDFGPWGRVAKTAVPGAAGLPDGPVTALVRPEAVTLALDTPPGGSPSAGEGLAGSGAAGGVGAHEVGLAAAAVVVDVSFGGERSLVKLAVHGSPWIAAVFGAAGRRAASLTGQAVFLFVPVTALRILPSG